MLKAHKNMRKGVIIPPGCRERYHSLGEALLRPLATAGWTRSGFSRLVPGYRIAATHHDGIIMATTAGRGELVTVDGPRPLTAGVVAICPPQQPVIWSCAGASWTMAWCYLDVRRWRMPAQVEVRPWSRCQAWAVNLDGILDLHGKDRDARSRALRLSVDLVLDDLRDLLATAAITTVADPLEDTWQAVVDAVEEPWPVERFARAAGVSPPTVQRWARRRFGTSLHQRILALRLERAAEILRATDYPLAQVAALVGFSDAFTFSAAFRKRMGRPPSALRDPKP